MKWNAGAGSGERRKGRGHHLAVHERARAHVQGGWPKVSKGNRRNGWAGVGDRALMRLSLRLGCAKRIKQQARAAGMETTGLNHGCAAKRSAHFREGMAQPQKERRCRRAAWRKTPRRSTSLEALRAARSRWIRPGAGRRLANAQKKENPARSPNLAG